MKYISKEDMESVIKLTDRTNYKNIIICSRNGEFYIRYTKRLDYSLNFYISKLLKEGFTIQHIYDLDQQCIAEEYGSKKNSILPNKALNYATEKHKGQMRKGNNPKEYITHPINVANLVIKYKGNSHNINNLKAASYLHDTIEDTSATYYEIASEFGFEIASLVSELTTDKDLKNEIGKAKYLSIKMKNMTSWALVIKLCDRLDNISDLGNMDEQFRKKYINETLYIMNYIIQNRKLSKTHLNIINTIINILNDIIKYNYNTNSNEYKKVKSLLIEIPKIK